MPPKFIEEEEQLKAYEDALAIQEQNQGSMQNYAPAMFAGQQKQNLVEWQLDFKKELEDIERLLRSDVLIRDQDGNEIWIPNPDKSRIFFNNTGVTDIIREIRMFLNKNKVLSNYGIDEIKPRIKMISNEIRVLIYNNYEHYGMDNDYKMNNYSIIVLTISSMIEDAYRRAINGEERKDLNQARIVSQTDNQMNNNGMNGMNYPIVLSNKSNKKHWYNPLSWKN
jgi:hypothetical protein